ncbi:DUF1850 domain-containing protein [uncultured Ilyobacter sp.]|jgi:hypothetical protein|uniref:DUF1850 domain-containing protein n=1 Tax=uncultured Ilyobacter sp. TaxID=544433 RepID=UPI0029C09E23|nr:DUF1850 domain-containing protein [uncultured Ilyobacter sp.]
MNSIKKIISIFILVLIPLFIFQNSTLIIRDLSKDSIIFLNKVTPEDEFTMRWMHSVELQPWEEIFRVDQNYNIILDRTRFKSFGAGVPDSAGNKTEIKNGYVIFSGIDRKMPDLKYGISDFAKHTFLFKNKELKLYEIVENGNGVKIDIVQMRLYEYYFLKIKTTSPLI